MLFREAFETWEGTTQHIPIVDIKAALYKWVGESKPFAAMMQKALNVRSILSPIIYADEATAGNVLSADKGRKGISILYFIR